MAHSQSSAAESIDALMERRAALERTVASKQQQLATLDKRKQQYDRIMSAYKTCEWRRVVCGHVCARV